MKMKKQMRAMCMLAVTAMLVTALAGCGNSNAPATSADSSTKATTATTAATSAETTKPSAPEKITYVNLGGTGKAIIEQAAKDFEQKSGISVTIEDWPYSDAHTKYVTLLTSGDVPDIGYGFSGWAGEMKERGAAADVSKILSPEFLNDFSKATMDICKIDGGVWMVPSYMSIRTLIARPDVLKEKGITSLDTYDDVIAAAKKINNPPNMYGYALIAGHPKNTMDLFWTFLWSYGSDMLSPDGKTVQFNDAGGVEALTKYVELSKYAMPGYETFNITDMDAGFRSGNVAMIYHSGETMTNLKKNNQDTPYEIYLPAAGAEGKRHALGVMDVHFIFEKGNKEAAGKWLEFFQTPEYFGQILVNSGWIPNKGKLQEMDYYKNAEGYIKGFMAAEPYAKFKPTVVRYEELQQALANAVAKAVLGAASPKEALDEAAEICNKVLAKSN